MKIAAKDNKMPGLTHILIVDDEINLRRTLATILGREGYIVREAENTAVALRELKAHSFDLVFLDLNMPGRNGIELLADIRKLYVNLPVLILTAHATIESSIEAIRQGARDYMIKPIDPLQIVSRVRDILAEVQQSPRRRKIVSEIQDLLQELKVIDGSGATPTSLLAAVPPVASDRILQKGAFLLDLHARHATLQGNYIQATGNNFDFLVTLLRHAPTTITYQNLVQESQGYDVTVVEAKTLARWRIHELRQIIEKNTRKPEMLLTVRGVGYRMVI
jgi:DNA-binding response OmpR family regulator